MRHPILKQIPATAPGEYVADATEGITRVEDLPKPKVVERKRSRKRRPCPRCEESAYRLKQVRRVLHDLGDSVLALVY